jgi:hypothetical protein
MALLCSTAYTLSRSRIHRSLTGDKVNYGIGLSYWPGSHVAWRTATTTLCRGVDLIPQSGIYGFGYWTQFNRGGWGGGGGDAVTNQRVNMPAADVIPINWVCQVQPVIRG